MMYSFTIGDITIPVESGNGRISQTYEDATATSLLTLGDGSKIPQTFAGTLDKLNTTITGPQGWAPAALAGLDKHTPYVLKCSTPRAIHGLTASIAIPSKRRTDTDYTPRGYAIVNDEMVETTVSSIVGDTVNLATVTGATGYVVHYWPQITVHAFFSENADQGAAAYSWTLRCEEK